MTARGTMIHRATIQRDTETAKDTWGGAAAPTYENHLQSEPCRAWLRTTNPGREISDEDKTVVIQARQIIFALDTDITERDQITRITDRQGTEVMSGPMEVEVVGVRKDHLVISAREIGG